MNLHDNPAMRTPKAANASEPAPRADAPEPSQDPQHAASGKPNQPQRRTPIPHGVHVDECSPFPGA